MIIILRHCVWARHPALLRSQPSLWGWTPVPGTWQLLGYIALASFPLSWNPECNRCNYSVQSRKSIHTHVTLSPIHLRSLCTRIIEMLWCPQYPVDLPGYNDASHGQWHIWPEVMELHMNCKSVSLSTVIFDVDFAFPFASRGSASRAAQSWGKARNFWRATHRASAGNVAQVWRYGGKHH